MYIKLNRYINTSVLEIHKLQNNLTGKSCCCFEIYKSMGFDQTSRKNARYLTEKNYNEKC